MCDFFEGMVSMECYKDYYEGLSSKKESETKEVDEDTNLLALLQSGLTTSQVAIHFSVSRMTISRKIKKYNIKNSGTDKHTKWVKGENYV